jgi:hypothetical protein
VPFGERRGGFRVPRQRPDETVEAGGVEFEPRRELPQERAQVLLQPQHAGGEEIGERRFDVVKLFEVGDEPAALDGKDKAFRRLVMPSGKGIGVLERVVGAVDLDRVDQPAGIGELI